APVRTDLPLEGTGFELPVPPFAEWLLVVYECRCRTCPMSPLGIGFAQPALCCHEKALLRRSQARRWPSRTREIRAMSAEKGISPWRNPFSQAGLVIAASR